MQNGEGVLKELMVFALIYNVMRLVMGQAARRQHVNSERISFIDALRWLVSAQDDELLPALVVNSSPSQSLRTACTDTTAKAIYPDDKAETRIAQLIGK